MLADLQDICQEPHRSSFSRMNRKMKDKSKIAHGKESSSVPGGYTHTGDQDESGVKISRPGWESRWKSRVMEPEDLVKAFFPLKHERLP